MAKEIKYKTAIDENGKAIHIDDAEKGKAYYCSDPSCENSEFILRKSGNTGPGSRRPHFAHKNPNAKCSPDRVLHFSYIRALINLLEGYKAENKAYEIDWYCNVCRKKHKGNLLAKVASIEEEKDLKDCRPDIALLDKDGNVLIVIEIVVTHEPEENALEYYKKNNIILIQIHLFSDEDLKKVETRSSSPDIVDYCYNPECSINSRYTISRKIKVEIDRCRRCFGRIEKYSIEIDSVFGKQQSLDFTDSDIGVVKSKRKYIKVKTDESTKEKYPVYDCLNCRRIRSRGRSSWL